MNTWKTTWTLSALTLLAGLLAPAITSAGSIEDRAGFFSKEAVRDADVRLGTVQKEHNAELRIETYAGVPDDQKATVAAMTREERSKYFLTWMQKRAGEIHAGGVLVLICKDPTYLEIGAGKNFRERGFTSAQREEMATHMMSSFKAKKYDEGLAKLVDDFAKDAARLHSANQVTHARSNAPMAPPIRHGQGPAAGNMSWLWTVGLIVLGVWLISALFRGFSHAASPMMGGAGMPMGGGGFGGGFLSGLFGSMAGMWMYDSFFRNNHAWGGPTMGGYNDGGGMNSWNDSPSGTSDGSDFEGSGGDFGSGDNGGGFFGGGGDSGGFADFGGGGGDFGGGGGDFSGGGGDFG